MPLTKSYVADYFRASREVQGLAADDCADAIIVGARMLIDAFRAGGKVLLCGNGGSAADCQHVAAELVSVLNRDFVRPALPAIALTTDSSFITAYGNDFGFEGVFARQVEALGRAGDVLFGISTSGNSENVRKAVRAATERSLRTLVLVGEGGKVATEADCAIVIPDRRTQHVQEAMLLIEHLICLMVEDELFGRGSE